MFQRAVMGTKTSQVRTRNLSAILVSLLHAKGLSRAQLCDLTGLSATTITKLTNELINQELVIEKGIIKTSDEPTVGRPQRALYLVPSARYALAIHFNVGFVQIALTDLLGDIQVSEVLQFTEDMPAETVLNDVSQAVHELLIVQETNIQQIVGVGIATSGLVNPETGVNIVSPNLGWHDVPLQEYFSNALDLPVVVDNNVRAMALGEAMFGLARDVQSVAFVFSQIGVGAGLVVNGEIYRGGGGGAGEIGHTTIMLHDGEACRCGNTGCLETLVSERAILREAQAIHSRLKSIQDVFAAARSDDAKILNLLQERAEYMGVALANLINIFNPELIVLGGTFADGADLLLPHLKRTIKQRTFGDLGQWVHVQSTKIEAVGLVGASALALDAFFYRQPDDMSLAI